MNWTSGYVADIGYTAGFYRETAPIHMAFVALTIGRSPGRGLYPKRMLELGFGQGFGLALLAAANPDVAFEGYDFNPEHVANAKRLIEGAGLANVMVSETASRKPLRAAATTTSTSSRCTASSVGWRDRSRMRSWRSRAPATAARRSRLRLLQLHAGLGAAGADPASHG
jgi:SAM-dependent methyltransferase